jgi:hypothetical protein
MPSWGLRPRLYAAARFAGCQRDAAITKSFCAFCAFLWLAFVKMAAFLNPA